ncbi:plasmid replication protein RepC [Neorhizobium sp. NCHU2750]|uniref:plasmid replication protein RepC n=1 Tax=Neorhizobium sp. NCHU2750 TaxID=1825976 RepID=UPI000E75E6AE
MRTGQVTTPFGRRPMTLALVKGQLQTPAGQASRPVEKWKVFRDIAEARQLLGLQDRALAVLDALLTFYPSNELSSEDKLVVFPSNAQLSVRAHGIAGTTLRRHLAALVEAGLIHRRDSPNGKRYAHRGQGGEIEDAFGFDLEPLLLRAAELAALAQQVAAERIRFKRAKEALTLCRRDIRKLLTAAMEEGAEGDWGQMEEIYVSLIARLPRAPSRENVEATLDEMAMLREEIVNRLEMQVKTQKTDGNDGQNGRHIQNSNPESIHDLEPSSEKEQEAKPEPTKVLQSETLKAFPLSMVLRACPQIGDYAVGGAISHWREFMAAAVVVRSVLGVSPSAYQDACEIMGPENAAVAMACILERAGHINSPGGYLRDLTSKARRGEFSLGPMLMALMRANGNGTRLAG